MTKKSGWSLDSLVLIFSFIVVAQILTYVIPQGQYERVPYPDNPNRQMVVADTYAPVSAEDRVNLPWYTFLKSVGKGLEEAQDIVFLVFLVGGVIALLRATGAIDAALLSAVRMFGSQPWILIAGCLVIFSMGSYSIGMGEEYVPLIPILITMCLAMKMDSIVAMGLIWVPYSIGWACAGFNPFGVVIAQNLAGVPITSGAGARAFMMLAFLAVAFWHVYAYARRILADPSKSLVAHVDYSEGFEPPKDTELNGRRITILIMFVGALVLFVWGAATRGWYISMLNAVFLGLGILSAIVAGMKPGETSRTFIRGASEMTSAALLIGFARTIEVVLSDGQVIDTIIYGIAGLLRNQGAEVASLGMLAVQAITNFFIPSGSGQAYVTMPIMSPLATLTGVPQQTAVLAYQFGDGFTNMIVPTSALVMGTLALGRIPYTAWVRFAAPLLVKLFLLAAVFLVLSVRFGSAVGL